MNKSSIYMVVGCCAVAGVLLLACAGLFAVGLMYRVVHEPASRLTRAEREALAAAEIQKAVLAYAGKDRTFKLLSIHEERDGRFSAFGSTRDPSDKYGESSQPWTAVVRMEGDVPLLAFMTYGMNKEVIYDERKSAKAQPAP